MSAYRLAAAAAFAFAAASAPAAAPPAAQTIQLFSYGFNPKPISLAAGHEVKLTFANTSKNSHDFTAKEFFGASRIVSGDVKEGEVELHGGESKTVVLVPTAGTYHAHCGHPFHSAMGMHTDIYVR